MAESSEWDKTLAALNRPQSGSDKLSALVIPEKLPAPAGKHSTAG
jgi:hypothetical protein